MKNCKSLIKYQINTNITANIGIEDANTTNIDATNISINGDIISIIGDIDANIGAAGIKLPFYL